jgi:SAM-dependent methyltransferase
MPTDQQTYAFRNARTAQRRRLEALEALLDDGSTRILAARGVAPGWSCLEVGGGGGSIARWLAERVGPEGTVLATDLDTTVLAASAAPNLEVRTHDVLVDDLPAGAFDLVHLRLVLAWVADPALALERLVAALTPGGVLVAEEMDFASVAPDPRVDPAARAAFERYLHGHHALLRDRHGFDRFYGRRVAGDLAASVLVDIGSEGRVGMWRGGEPGGLVWRLSLDQLRDGLLDGGYAEAADLDVVAAALDDPGFSFMSQVTMAAWGRRPVP